MIEEDVANGIDGAFASEPTANPVVVTVGADANLTIAFLDVVGENNDGKGIVTVTAGGDRSLKYLIRTAADELAGGLIFTSGQDTWADWKDLTSGGMEVDGMINGNTIYAAEVVTANVTLVKWNKVEISGILD